MCQVREEALQQEVNNGSVLLVGPHQVGKYTLATRLLQPATAAEKHANCQQLWHLDTKYYTTDVSLQRSHPSEDAYQLATDSQGIVLVFAADSESSFQAVSQWAEQLPSSVGDVRLCVANKVDKVADQCSGAGEHKAELQRSSWLDAAIIWCAENQYEYIEACSTNTQLDAGLVWEEQQQGVHRVKQALEANYWPNLMMRQPQLTPQQQGCHEPSQFPSVADHTGEDGCSSSDLSEQEEHDFSQFQSAEEQLDQFDRMFGELRATRDKLQHLSREQRQQGAADMALRIAGLLSLEDSSDGDDDPAIHQLS
ncbi:hypothetical protein ABBQ38_006210 [Trebouxia sp. C0009 RCD-2024]